MRLFGGYDYQDTYASSEAMVRDGYEKGVPMGFGLGKATAGQLPKFLVWAQKDPIGPNLDRIQLIKGWYENGELKEQIYNVAVSDGRLNEATGAFNTEKGDVELMAVWTDPDFDPALNAFYYARVIQLPTARWTLFDQIREGVTFPEEADMVIQERAWSSPIWYVP